MKTIKTLLAVLFVFNVIGLQAQNLTKKNQKSKKRANYEAILEKKLAYMKENLMLTPAETQAFEKVYREYSKKKIELHKKMRNDFYSKIKKGKYLDMSDTDLNIILDKKIKLDDEKTKIETEFIQNLRKVLPPKKVIKYFRADRSFNRKIMNKYHNSKDRYNHKK